jgi:hypothetical protein
VAPGRSKTAMAPGAAAMSDTSWLTSATRRAPGAGRGPGG